MNPLLFMFSSPYDQASLAVMVVGLVANAVIDRARRRRDAP